MPQSRFFNIAHMSLNAHRENKITAKMSKIQYLYTSIIGTDILNV